MTTKATTVEGTIKPDGTLELAQKLALPAGKVRVTVETIADAGQDQPGLAKLFERIRQQQSASKDKGRTREEIDADVNAMRNEWEERMAEIEHLQDEARQQKESTDC